MTLDIPKQAGSVSLEFLSQIPQWPFVRAVGGYSVQESTPGDWGIVSVVEELTTQVWYSRTHVKSQAGLAHACHPSAGEAEAENFQIASLAK